MRNTPEISDGRRDTSRHHGARMAKRSSASAGVDDGSGPQQPSPIEGAGAATEAVLLLPASPPTSTCVEGGVSSIRRSRWLRPGSSGPQHSLLIVFRPARFRAHNTTARHSSHRRTVSQRRTRAQCPPAERLPASGGGPRSRSVSACPQALRRLSRTPADMPDGSTRLSASVRAPPTIVPDSREPPEAAGEYGNASDPPSPARDGSSHQDGTR